MPTIKGTASVTDDHAMAKLLKKTTFPSNFSTPVEVSKVNIPVMSQWVERKITELLGFEDEIVASTAINLFLPTALEGAPPPKVDPKRSQLDLVGFLGEDDAAAFCKELWTLLLDAQETSTGIPRKLLEDTKKELASRQHHQRRQHRGMPPGGARGGHEQSQVMNPMVREASRRAEAARQAFANAPPPLARRQDAQPPAAPASGSNPVPVSPPRVADHAFEPRPPPQSRREDGRDDFGRAPRNPNDDNGNNNRYNNHNPRSDQQPPRSNSPSRSNSESVSSSSSASSNSYYDSEEDQRLDRRGGGGGGERWRRYEDEEDRRRARYRQEDVYGRPRHPPRHRNDDYQHRHGRHRHYDRERNHRGDRDDRRRRERSRSYERNERRGGRHRRTRSYSD